MSKYIKPIFLIVGIIYLWFLQPVFSAEPQDQLTCSTCQYENQALNQFCAGCGDPLLDERTQQQQDQQNQEFYLHKFAAERVDPPRLFSIPTAQVLGSMDVRLVGGGAFGVATDKSLLGTVGIGLGNIAEVEFSTIGMANNISRGSTVFPTSAFKLIIIPENRFHIPTLAIALRSSSNWQDARSDMEVLKADMLNVGYNDEGINSIGYDTRFTTMYGVTSIRLWKVGIHMGATLTDIRVRDLSVDYYMSDTYYDSREKQKNLIGGFFGVNVESNPQTKIMLEIKTLSNFQYNIETQMIDVSQAILAIGGVRFFFNRWLSTDVGVWYQNTFIGIADMQVKLGINLFIPGQRIGKKIFRMKFNKLK